MRLVALPGFWVTMDLGGVSCQFSFDEKIEEIAAACQRYGVERLFVFGSVLREDFRPGESDIDLLVEFGPMEVTKRFHAYLDAREAFRNIF